MPCPLLPSKRRETTNRLVLVGDRFAGLVLAAAKDLGKTNLVDESRRRSLRQRLVLGRRVAFAGSIIRLDGFPIVDLPRPVHRSSGTLQIDSARHGPENFRD